MMKDILFDLDEKSSFENGCVRFTEKDIVEIHDGKIAKYGGEYGIRDRGLLRSACEMPYQEMFGTELFPTPYDKAARYLFAFANYQIFVDGNKRTGFAVADIYLKCNGVILDLSMEDAYNFTMDIANHKLEDISKISTYLNMHSHIDNKLKQYMYEEFIKTENTENKKENDYEQDFIR